MTHSPASFNAVYHLAALNHWRDVLAEQLPLLLRGQVGGTGPGLNGLWVTVAAADPATAAEAAARIDAAVEERVRRRGMDLPVRLYHTALGEFEHQAVRLADEVAQSDDRPVLYFHAKAVSYNPPWPTGEAVRRYLNRLVADAARWAGFLTASGYDACGPLRIHDASHGYTYFGGNFWMARAEYLRGLTPYRDFITRTPVPGFSVGDRHFAELAVNRDGRMNGYAIDGTNLAIRGSR